MNTFVRKPTRSDRTKVSYEARFKQLRARFSRDAGMGELTPDEVVAHLILLRPELSPRTWRNYKAATLYYLETYHPQHTTAIAELTKYTSVGLTDRASRTSGRKIKQVPEAAWAAIKFSLLQRERRGHKYSRGLLTICEATLLTGLRPVEWSFSEISTHAEDGRRILHVRNAKHSNGRANGPTREMYIDGLTDVEIGLLREAIALSECADEAQAEKLQLALKHELEAARGVDLSPHNRRQSSVTLYSFRHQFIANAKQTFDDPVITAAVVGHYSTKTANEHYGKRRHGQTKVRVFPTESSVSAVHSRHLETYRDYIAQRGAQPGRSLEAST